MSYAKEVSRHRRLTILRFLSDSPEYTSNAALLQSVCAEFGIASTRDQIKTEILWLEQNGFVTSQDNADFIVATATQSGLEIASGLTKHPGIIRPRPEQ